MCLDRELRASGSSAAANRQAVALLDSIIADVAKRLPARVNSADPAQARDCFKVIETILAERQFYVAIPTSALMDTLIPSPRPATGKRLTHERRDLVGKSHDTASHRMDCDTGSLIYAAVGEALKLPIVVVEAPGHKFVRWKLSGRQYVNWDTNAAREYSNDAFRKGKTLTYKTTISRAEEAAGKFLTALTRDDVLAYHRNIVASIHEKKEAYRQAEKEYLSALKVRPHDSLAANNLAWIYLDHHPLRSSANVRTALQLAQKATSILPRNPDYLDTLARAYAANNQFEQAIASERKGYNNREHITLFQQRKAY
ncbi:MAG: tetratricopeptide (TPR) repeat protein [Verrucomicrobiales bacterium]|jgi:tetratricopeptide (TPR) repeat protein